MHIHPKISTFEEYREEFPAKFDEQLTRSKVRRGLNFHSSRQSWLSRLNLLHKAISRLLLLQSFFADYHLNYLF